MDNSSIDNDTKEILTQWSYEKLSRIGSEKETVILELGEDENYDFKTDGKGDADKIFELIIEYNKYDKESRKQQKYYEGITTGAVEIDSNRPKVPSGLIQFCFTVEIR